MHTKNKKALRWVAFETIPAGVDQAWLVEYEPKGGSRLGQIELTSAGHKWTGAWATLDTNEFDLYGFSRGKDLEADRRLYRQAVALLRAYIHQTTVH
jgi:hypothetical protein